MADNIATLGLRLDANGFVNSTNQVSGVLDGLGESSRKVQNKIQNFATAGGFALGSLASGGVQSITSVLRSFSGLGFAIGPITGAIALAVSSIGIAFFESQKQAKEATQKMIDDLHNMEREFSESAKRMRLSTLTAQRDAIQDKIATTPTWTMGPRGFPLKTDFTSMAAEAEKLNDRIWAIRNSLMDTARASQAAFDADAPKRFKEQIDAATAMVMEQYALREEQEGADEARSDAEVKRIKALGVEEESAAYLAIKAWEELDRSREAADKERLARVRSIGEALAGTVIGAIGGAVGGPLGGVISGGAAGIPGGALGIGIGAAQGFVNALMGIGEAAQRQAEKMRELRKAYDDLSDQLAVLLGTMGSVEARQRAITREYAAHREELQRSIRTLEEAIKQGQLTRDEYKLATDLIKRQKEELTLLNETAAARIALLEVETRQYNKTMQEDLEVRRLRAHGNAEEADALAFALEQQREYKKAVDDGANAVTLAALAEVHRVEKLNWAMGKIQARIDELARTIDGLEAFKSSLLLSGTRSPTDQLAEATRQYDEILKAAQGGDQGAAGRMPAAAQAFLDASRAVNASGPAFAADFKRVLDETNALIQQFKDAKSIEELQLEVLREIRDGKTIHGDGGHPLGMPGDPGTELPLGEIVTQTRASVTVQTEGFTQMVARLDTLATKLDGLEGATRRGFDGLNGARLN